MITEGWDGKCFCTAFMCANRITEKLAADGKSCCSCEACLQACPTGAVSMAEDALGFRVCRIDAAKCVDCGICSGVCPMNAVSRLSRDVPECAAAAVHLDAEVLRESSSGGAFTALVQLFCGPDGLAAGAVMDENFDVRHELVRGADNIAPFRKSKYLPSSSNSCFLKVRKALSEGERVLFSGTPCQVAALRLFLRGRDFENLLTVDFSCHGPGSPKIFKQYAGELGREEKSRLVEFSFRHKTRRFRHYSSHSSWARFENGKERVSFHDPWFGGFVRGLFKMDACHQCPYVGLERVSDVTVADFWGVEHVSADLEGGRGVSLVLANTAKGKRLAERLPELMRVENFPLDSCVPYNGPLRERLGRNPMREKFLEAVKSGTVKSALEGLNPRGGVSAHAEELVFDLFPARLRQAWREKWWGLKGALKSKMLSLFGRKR